MAEFLIRRTEHWAEAVKPPSWSDMKWAGRPMRGDIVEVQANGFYRIEALGSGTHHWPRQFFALVRITNLQVAQALAYLGSWYDNPDNPTRFFKSRYRYASWASIPWIKTIVTPGDVPEEEWYYIRQNVGGFASLTDKTTL